MDCKKAYKYFNNSLKNKLSQKQLSEFNSHLKECKHCNTIFNEINTTYNSFEFNNTLENNSPYFFSKLMAAIENKNQQKNSFALKLKPAMISAWFLFALVLGVTLGSDLIQNIKTDNYSSSETINDDDFIDVFNLSEIDKESFEYLLLQ